MSASAKRANRFQTAASGRPDHGERGRAHESNRFACSYLTRVVWCVRISMVLPNISAVDGVTRILRLNLMHVSAQSACQPDVYADETVFCGIKPDRSLAIGMSPREDAYSNAIDYSIRLKALCCRHSKTVIAVWHDRRVQNSQYRANLMRAVQVEMVITPSQVGPA
jgi:hypothetical protein